MTPVKAEQTARIRVQPESGRMSPKPTVKKLTPAKYQLSITESMPSKLARSPYQTKPQPMISSPTQITSRHSSETGPKAPSILSRRSSSLMRLPTLRHGGQASR